MAPKTKMKTTIDTQTGKRFRYNSTIEYMGKIVPALVSAQTSTHLAPDRVPPELLRQLNPPRRCMMCGATEGEPHHDESCNGVIVELAPHACLLTPVCWVDGRLVCQPCLQGSRENELEKSGTPEGMLAKAARLQTEFWEALGDLEHELGIEIDSARDLQGMTVEDLKEDGEEDDDEAEEPGDDDEKDPE